MASAPGAVAGGGRGAFAAAQTPSENATTAL